MTGATPVAVLYATREGHARRVAERIVSSATTAGVEAAAFDLGAASPDITRAAAVVLVGSVHAGHVERELVRYVREHRAAIESLPHAFALLSLSQAGVQRTNATPAEHARFVADVTRLRDALVADIGWTPRHLHHVAGALPFTRYPWPIRLVMRRISRRSGGDTDTRRDFIYTDWDDLDRFVGGFLASAGLLRG